MVEEGGSVEREEGAFCCAGAFQGEAVPSQHIHTDSAYTRIHTQCHSPSPARCFLAAGDSLATDYGPPAYRNPIRRRDGSPAPANTTKEAVLYAVHSDNSWRLADEIGPFVHAAGCVLEALAMP